MVEKKEMVSVLVIIKPWSCRL